MNLCRYSTGYLIFRHTFFAFDNKIKSLLFVNYDVKNSDSPVKCDSRAC
jgi:hypothetical protein